MSRIGQGHPEPTTPAAMLRGIGIDPEGLTQQQQLGVIKEHWPEPEWDEDRGMTTTKQPGYYRDEDCANYDHDACLVLRCRCDCHKARPVPARQGAQVAGRSNVKGKGAVRGASGSAARSRAGATMVAPHAVNVGRPGR